MIDYANAVFTAVCEPVMAAFPELNVTSEYLRRPAKFPCLTLDEISNVTVYPDNTANESYCRVTYRAQIFTDEQTGKRSAARAILSKLDEAFQNYNFIRRSYMTNPDLYRSNFYAITVTYEAVIGTDGTIYRV